MRSILAVAAVFASLIASALAAPAMAAPDEATYDWLKLASSPDLSRTLYTLPDSIPSSSVPDARLMVMMQTRTGPAAAGGAFAVYITAYVRCADNTMAVASHYDYDRSGEAANGVNMADEDLDFQPVDLTNQYGLALQIGCGTYDTSALPRTGPVTAHQLIEADIAAYDSQNGGTYAY